MWSAMPMTDSVKETTGPRRPTKREITEALDILKKESADLRKWADREANSTYEYFVKMAGQRARKSDRLNKVIVWIEAQ
jgi:hypothetical protein